MRMSLKVAVLLAAVPVGCSGLDVPCASQPDARRSSIEPMPGGVLDRYLRAASAKERVAVVESITESTLESRRVLVLAFDGNDPDIMPAAVDTICRRFVGYVPPGGSETQIRVAAEWLSMHAR